MKPNLRVGLTFDKEYLLKKEYTAEHVGSGMLEVLSTPSMIALMEKTAMECVKPKLPEGYITVGHSVNVRHLSPVPIGERLRVTVQLKGIDGRRLTFKVKAEWRNEVIGEGQHERFIVNREKFLQKLEEKTR